MWYRGPSVFWGGILVILGVLFLLANLNVLQNLDWNVVWPIIVIALGVWLLAARVGPGGARTTLDYSEPRQGIDKARLEIAVGTGRLDVRSGALDDQLYRVHIDHAGAAPEVTLDRATATLRITQHVDWFAGARRLRIEARLSDAASWEVSCSTGAIRGEIDLSTAKLSAFECRTGASTLDLVLGAPKGVVPMRIDGGALTIRITRPAGTAVQVQASGAGVQLNADGTQLNGLGTRAWKSDGFDAAADRYEMTISGAALNVDVAGR